LKSSPPVIRQALMKVNWAKRSTSLRVCWASSRVGSRISARARSRLVLGEQTVQQRQDEGGGLAAAGLRRHPQVAPSSAFGMAAAWTGVGSTKDSFPRLEQAFVQGELGKQGRPRGRENRTAA
jgi:hypothetical protein